MALEKLRGRWTAAVEPVVAKLHWLDPNHLSWFSLLVTIGAGYLLATAGRDAEGGCLLLLAAGLIVIASACDALDGQIARHHNKDSDYGDFLDHTIDRIVDAGLLVAIGINSAWLPNPHLGYIAALATLLGSYMGTQSQSVGLGRNYAGFSRADRLVATLLGVLVASGQASLTIADPYVLPISGIPINGMSAALLFALLGGVYTFVKRFSTARKELQERLN